MTVRDHRNDYSNVVGGGRRAVIAISTANRLSRCAIMEMESCEVMVLHFRPFSVQTSISLIFRT